MSRKYCVYLVQCGHEKGPIKIGVTNNLDKRIETLQIGCPWKLNPIALISVDSEKHAFEVECRLHDRFKRHHMRGEWFKCKIVLGVANEPNISWLDNDAYAMAVIPGRFKNLNR